jgi:hypothetical protein
MAISVPDVNKLRNSTSQWVSLTLNAVPLTLVASARVNQALFTHTTETLTVDTISADWTTKVKRGMRMCVGTTPGAWDVFSSVVRATPTSTSIKFGAVSQGDSGYATDIRIPLSDNLYVSVYQDRPPWSFYSSIRNSVFYKEYSDPYVDQNTEPAPIVNMGHHRQVWTTDSTVQLTFPDVAGGVLPWGSATITDYAWTCETATPVGAEDSSFVTYEFEPGFHIVELTATDSNGKVNSGFRHVFVNHKTLYPGVTAPWDNLNAPTDRTGLKMSLTIYGDYTEADIYPGQAWMLTENAYFDGEDLDEPEQRVSQFFGYLPEITTVRSLTKPSIDLVIESPFNYARRMGAVSQLMVEKTSPANWTQVSSTLSNPIGAAWYILQYHAPNILAGHDFLFDPTLKTLRKQSIDFPRGSIGGQLEYVQNLAYGNIGCRADGSIVFAHIPMYLDNTGRNALDTIYTWEASDIVAPFSFDRAFAMSVRQTKVGIFIYNGGAQATAYLCQAPGAVEAQGGSDEAEIDVIARTSEGLSRGLELVGHHFAYTSARTKQFTTTVRRNIDIAEPVNCDEWHMMDVPSTYDPYGEGWVNRRIIPYRVSRSYRLSDRQTISKSISIEWQPESYGLPGIDVTPPRGGASSEVNNGVIIQVSEPLDQRIRAAFALAWNGVEFAPTTSFNSSYPAWAALGLVGTPCDAAPDYASEYFQTGVGELLFWLITTDDTDLYIYKGGVRTGEVEITLQHTYTMNDDTVTTSARVCSSKHTPEFCAVAFKDGTGTLVGRTTDSGATWETLVRAGDSITDDPANDNAVIGFAVEGVDQIVTAPDGAEWHLFYANGTGAFNLITDSVAGGAPHPMIAIEQGTVYATVIPLPPGSDASANITFDSGGTGYITSQSGDSAHGISAGISGNSFKCTFTTSGTKTMVVEMDVAWSADQTVLSVSMDMRVDYTRSFSGSDSAELITIEYLDEFSSPVDAYTVVPSWSPGTVQNYTASDSTSVPGVRLVRFSWAVTISGTPDRDVYMDNCQANI